MSNSFIGQYLLEKKLLTQTQLDKALHIQRESNVRLGQLSIDQGLMSIKQVLHINQQQRLLNKKFGDIAIDNLFLSSTQVEQLLELQKSQRKLLGKILIEEGFVDENTLNEILLAQRQHQYSLSHSIGEITNIHSLGKTVNDILISYEKLFLRCLNSHFKVSHIIKNIKECDQRKNIIGLTINSSQSPICIAIAINNTTMANICCQFMSIEKSDCDIELAKDAAGEFLNCVAGYIITDVIEKMDSPTPSQAFFVDSTNELIQPYHDPVAVEFSSSVGAGAIIIAGS